MGKHLVSITSVSIGNDEKQVIERILRLKKVVDEFETQPEISCPWVRERYNTAMRQLIEADDTMDDILSHYGLLS